MNKKEVLICNTFSKYAQWGKKCSQKFCKKPSKQCRVEEHCVAEWRSSSRCVVCHECAHNKELYGYVMQDNGMALTTDISVFDEWMMDRQLWKPRSTDLNPCEFYL
jgi:hypothetical protein